MARADSDLSTKSSTNVCSAGLESSFRAFGSDLNVKTQKSQLVLCLAQFTQDALLISMFAHKKAGKSFHVACMLCEHPICNNVPHYLRSYCNLLYVLCELGFKSKRITSLELWPFLQGNEPHLFC